MEGHAARPFARGLLFQSRLKGRDLGAREHILDDAIALAVEL
jgi:hypothetical protein